MPANQPAKREKSNGFCSRVSTTTTGRGVLSCVPPRSASTGITGGGTGAAVICHAKGEVINVLGLFISVFFMRRSFPVGIHGVNRPEPILSRHADLVEAGGDGPVELRADSEPEWAVPALSCYEVVRNCNARPIPAKSFADVSRRAESRNPSTRDGWF